MSATLFHLDDGVYSMSHEELKDILESYSKYSKGEIVGFEWFDGGLAILVPSMVAEDDVPAIAGHVPVRINVSREGFQAALTLLRNLPITLRHGLVMEVIEVYDVFNIVKRRWREERY